MLTDIAQIQDIQRPSRIDRRCSGRTGGRPGIPAGSTVMAEDMPAEAARLWTQLQRDLRGLEAEFEVWIDWYQDRLDGSRSTVIERQWALLRRSSLRKARPKSTPISRRCVTALDKGTQARPGDLHRAWQGRRKHRSSCAAWRGCDRRQGADDAGNRHQGCGVVHAQNGAGSGVLTSVTDYKDDDLTVHFWNFGGQVMAHATHQFFLRSKCLYVVVLGAAPNATPIRRRSIGWSMSAPSGITRRCCW